MVEIAPKPLSSRPTMQSWNCWKRTKEGDVWMGHFTSDRDAVAWKRFMGDGYVVNNCPPSSPSPKVGDIEPLPYYLRGANHAKVTRKPGHTGAPAFGKPAFTSPSTPPPAPRTDGPKAPEKPGRAPLGTIKPPVTKPVSRPSKRAKEHEALKAKAREALRKIREEEQKELDK